MIHPHVSAMWHRDNLEKLRFDYKIYKHDIVIDIGANIGVFADVIHKKYGCYVYAFEPGEEYYDILEKKFKGNDKIIIRNYAITGNGGFINYDGDSESCVISGDKKVLSKSINDIILIDTALVKINIEGGEYDLLEQIEEDRLKLVENLQVQFHILDDTSFKRRFDIQEKLSRTHELEYCYEFVWESWRRKT